MAIAYAAMLMVSCSDRSKTADTANTTENTDAKEAAKDSNENKFDTTAIHDDTKFAVSAADGGMLEVELGKLALTKSKSTEVKNFAKMMVTDHASSNEELKALSGKKNISIPAVLSNDRQEKIADFVKKSDTDFDKDYISFMVKDHKDDIDLFKKEASDGKDADIKSWAASKVAILEHHLEMAKNAEEVLKNKKK